MKTSSERLGEALERAKNHWQRATKAAAFEASAAVATCTATIALTREAGTNGGSVARTLGKRLGWPVYDRELLQLIANEMGLRTKLVESVDEKQTSWLRECLEAFSSAPTVSASAYVRHLTEMMLSLAAHGACVIVGRGAAQILPPEWTFRVRLVAPLQERIRGIERRFGISHVQAAQWVEKTDRERALFVKEYFQKDTGNPQGYDLVLNTARFSIEDCVEVIHAALKCWRWHDSGGDTACRS